MFKILRLIVIAAIIITLAGCSVSSTEESKVKEVSQKYLTDSFEFNYQMTREMPGLQYVTSEFKEELTKRFTDLLTATTGANLIQRVLDLNLSSIQLSSETLANVRYEVKVNISTIIKPDYTETYKGTLYLRNKNGQWQVNGNQLENHDWILPSLPTIQKTIVLGEQEESEKLRIKLNASGFSSRNSLIQPLVENAEMVVLIAYPESAPAPFYLDYFKDLQAKDKNYINIKKKNGQTLVYIKGENKENVLKLVDLIDDYNNETYKILP